MTREVSYTVESLGFRAHVLRALGGSGYYVVSGRELLDGVRAVPRQFFDATWASQLIAAVPSVVCATVVSTVAGLRAGAGGGAASAQASRIRVRPPAPRRV
jgi:hypothetical protein